MVIEDRLPGRFWVLWAGALVNRLGSFVVPYLSLWLTGARGLSATQAGVIVGLYGFGSALAMPLGGWLSDHVGRRAVLVLGLGGGAAAVLHLALARSPGHVAAAALLLGFVGDLYRPASSAAVADLVPETQRVRAYGLMYWAANLGWAIALPLGGMMAQRGFWLLFAGDAATSAVFALIVLRGIPETRPVAVPGALPPDYTRPFRDLPFMAFIGLSFVACAILLQLNVTLPLGLRDRGLQPSRIGLLLGLNGLVIVLVQPVAVRVLRSLGRGPTLAASALLIGVGICGAGLAPTQGGVAAGMVVLTLGEIAFTSVAPALVAQASPPDLRGSYQGLYHLSWAAAACAGPLLGPLVQEAAGARTLWYGCAVVGALAAVGQLALAARTGAARSSLVK